MKKNTMKYHGMMFVACAAFANVLAAEQATGESKAGASQTVTLESRGLPLVLWNNDNSDLCQSA